MQEITVDATPIIQPHEFEHALEEFVWRDNRVKVKVRHKGVAPDGRNLYTIHSETPQGFYLAGIVTAIMMRQLEDRED